MNSLNILRLILAAFCIAAFSSSAAAEDHVLLIGGLGGEAKYSEEFLKSLGELRELLTKKHGYNAKRVRLLAEAGDDTRKIDAVSTLANIEKEFGRLKAGMSSDDTLLLIMIGHGQSDYRVPKFNLPGPDLSAQALGKMLADLPGQDQRLILAFGCSGHFTEFISGPLRIVLASGDGPRQIYHSVMPTCLVEALSSNEADFDMDGEITFYEIFDIISEKVEDHFKGMGALQTENPSLDDNGDGEVTTLMEGMDAGDGENAKKTVLAPAPSKISLASKGKEQ